jgi:hypothetical protein
MAAGAVALPALPRVASALDYPTRAVRIIVGFPAGGTHPRMPAFLPLFVQQRTLQCEALITRRNPSCLRMFTRKSNNKHRKLN